MHQKLPFWKEKQMAEIAGDLLGENCRIMEEYN